METYYHPHDLPKFAEMSQGNSALWEKFLSESFNQVVIRVHPGSHCPKIWRRVPW